MGTGQKLSHRSSGSHAHHLIDQIQLCPLVVLDRDFRAGLSSGAQAIEGELCVELQIWNDDSDDAAGLQDAKAFGQYGISFAPREVFEKMRRVDGVERAVVERK